MDGTDLSEYIEIARYSSRNMGLHGSLGVEIYAQVVY